VVTRKLRLSEEPVDNQRWAKIVQIFQNIEGSFWNLNFGNNSQEDLGKVNLVFFIPLQQVGELGNHVTDLVQVLILLLAGYMILASY
jgi:hypothetical protein